jgi:hypothetical protein
MESHLAINISSDGITVRLTPRGSTAGLEFAFWRRSKLNFCVMASPQNSLLT